MQSVDIKRTLRELKRLEQRIRHGKMPLVWEVFFDLQDTGAGKAKYPLKILMAMDHETLRHVIGEYWSFVYSELFNESDISGSVQYDMNLLLQWGLPADADADTIKKKFRELAKLYHPDAGGDEQSFIALMEAFNRFMGK